MNKPIAKTIVFIALSLASVFAQNGKNPAHEDSLETAIGSLSKTVNNLSEKQSETKRIIDSVSIKAIKESHEHYSNSFNHLLIVFSIFTAVFVFIFAFAQHFISASNLKIIKKYFKKETLVSENELNEEIKNQEKIFKSIKNNICGELSKSYLYSIDKTKLENITEEDFLIFFHQITFFYHILQKYEVELDKKDSAHFRFVNKLIAKNMKPFDASKDPRLFGFFFSSLKNMIKYCKKINREEEKEILDETWKKSCYIFGGEKKVLEITENYNNNMYDFKI